MKTKKRIWLQVTAAVLAVTLCFASAGCADDEEDASSLQAGTAAQQYSDSDTWAVYWYLCGTDLESEDGAATSDLNEMMQVKLPPNVKVIIQTGGTKEWQNDEVDPNHIQRFVYDKNGFNKVDEQPLANMGDSKTLQGFLSYCKAKYPAKHQMMLFWDHGGGSLGGVEFDELHNDDSLTLDEIKTAFQAVYPANNAKPPFELVGLDTCLMATVDTAKTFLGTARYMVASEETEPGNGWLYSGWLDALAKHPGQNGAALGKAICDSYMQGCDDAQTADEATLSVTDLGKLPALLSAYDAVGVEALQAAAKDESFFAKLGRDAESAENYGGNTREQGYTDMVDLGHLMRNSQKILPQKSKAVLDALKACVLYKVQGEYRKQATGLSCYYTYDGDEENFGRFSKVGASQAFKSLYGFDLTGQMDEQGIQLLADAQKPKPVPKPTASDYEDAPLTVDAQGSAVLNLGAAKANRLTAVGFELASFNEKTNQMSMLGYDNDLDADWDKGVFKDNFRGVWGAIDGHYVYMELSYEGDDYNVYAVPVQLNGKRCNLSVVYNFTSKKYQILGARAGVDTNGMADKNLTKLKPGDKITTLHYISSYTGSDEPKETPAETFVATKNTAFQERSLGNGQYAMMFDMTDTAGKSYTSQVCIFTIKNGEITTEA